MLLIRYPYEVLMCFGAFWIFFLLIGFTAYQVNSHRPKNDPKKRNLHPFAILMVPLLVLVLVPPAIVIFLLAAILYAGFILLFALMLVGLRRPFLIGLWMRFSMFIGEPLLRLGTYLIMLPFRIFRPPSGQQPLPA